MSSAVVVFVRAPEPGRCKTRLCPPLVPAQAAALYRAFCGDVLANAQRTRLPVWIAYDASDDFPAPDWVSPRLPFFHQEGADLGERLIHAFETLFLRGCRRVVAIGSDSPTLPRERLTAAFELLADYAAVFGPAEDGGYYLAGLSRPCPGLFWGIPWSTSRVLEATLAAAARDGIPAALLTQHGDVDTPDDLLRLADELARSPLDRAPATRAALAGIAPARATQGTTALE